MSFAGTARTASVLAMLCGLHALPALGQAPADFPNRPIRFIVPSVAGAGADITARVIAQHLTQASGQQVIVDNRAGASGVIAFDILTKASPDGYTLVLMSVNHPINKFTIRGFPYDLAEDVTPVSQATSLSYVVYVYGSTPFHRFSELIAYGKQNPGKLNYGTPGNFSTQHLGWELISHMTGAKFTHVPYKGGALAI
jgi:tripartite-type tricarboxylate transporter receptor subunit TctC